MFIAAKPAIVTGMNNPLVRVPVVNKNGVATTVHKRSDSKTNASTKLAGVAPPVPASTRSSSTPLPFVEPLTESEVDQFLTDYEPILTRSTKEVFRTLSGETQAVLKRMRDAEAFDDDEISDILDRFMLEMDIARKKGSKRPQNADPLLRSALVATERIMKDHPDLSSKAGELTYFRFAQSVLVGNMWQNEQLGKSVDLDSEEAVEACIGMVGFMMSAPADHTKTCLYIDKEGHQYHAERAVNERVAVHVMENPQVGYMLGDLASSRSLSNSDEDSQFLLDYAAEHGTKPVTSDGYL